MNPNKVNVAVVDDDESFACALERLFRASGFNVRTYPSAEVFLAAGALPQSDCLVLDIQLGGMSGLDLLRRLRGLGAVLPIIFVTARDAAGVREKAEQAGCSGYFLKPVRRQSIIAAIAKAVNPDSHEGHEGHEAPRQVPSVAEFAHLVNEVRGRGE